MPKKRKIKQRKYVAEPQLKTSRDKVSEHIVLVINKEDTDRSTVYPRGAIKDYFAPGTYLPEHMPDNKEVIVFRYSEETGYYHEIHAIY